MKQGGLLRQSYLAVYLFLERARMYEVLLLKNVRLLKCFEKAQFDYRHVSRLPIASAEWLES